MRGGRGSPEKEAGGGGARSSQCVPAMHNLTVPCSPRLVQEKTGAAGPKAEEPGNELRKVSAEITKTTRAAIFTPRSSAHVGTDFCSKEELDETKALESKCVQTSTASVETTRADKEVRYFSTARPAGRLHI